MNTNIFAFFRESEDKAAECDAAAGLGHVYQQMRDYTTSLRYYETELNVANELNQMALQARAYFHLGSAHECLGNINEALEFQELSLSASSRTSDKLLMVISHCSLGM